MDKSIICQISLDIHGMMRSVHGDTGRFETDANHLTSRGVVSGRTTGGTSSGGFRRFPPVCTSCRATNLRGSMARV